MNDPLFLMTRRLRHFLVLLGLLGGLGCSQAASLVLRVPPVYLPDVPLLVRVECLDAQGRPDRTRWDAEVTLRVDDLEVSLSTNQVTLRNGMGSVLVTAGGLSAFNLTASLDHHSSTREILNGSDLPRTTVSGELSEPETFWSGIVEVTDDIIVPPGSSLTLQPGTLVLMKPEQGLDPGASIRIGGTLRSLGEEGDRVTWVTADATARWGQITHLPGSVGDYRFTDIVMGGAVPGEGHTGTGPVLRVEGTDLSLAYCSVTDAADQQGGPGKIMIGRDSNIRLDRCLMTRARMGPEIFGGAFHAVDSYFLELRGPDDADGIYFHETRAGDTYTLERCVFAGGDDDGIDTLGAVLTVTDSIVRDWISGAGESKGMSVFGANVNLRGSIIANCDWGISAKSVGAPSLINVDRCTIQGVDRGLSATSKSSSSTADIQFSVTNSIVGGSTAIHSDFQEANVSVGYCNLTTAWVGVSNRVVAPHFFAAGSDFHLRPGSPCIDAGSPESSLDLDGTVADQGALATFTGEMLAAPDGVVINEIMYHPASEDVREEYIELHNRGTSPVDLSGWKVTAGVQFEIPTNTWVSAGGYLVIAADVAQFVQTYPPATSVVGGWVGILSNSGESIELSDADGAVVDRVDYADDGAWSTRERGPLDRGHRGWRWFSRADGMNASLELRNPYLSNQAGQNWGSSRWAGGTPGMANSLIAHNVAPLIRGVQQYPIVPRSSDSILIAAEVQDEQTSGVQVWLHYRPDALERVPFERRQMWDDGLHDDRLAGDGVFGMTLPPFMNNTVIEFFVEARDQAGNSASWPQPAMDSDGRFGQEANLLFQVDDTEYSSRYPLYRIIMREEEREELARIGSVSSEAGSNAQMNAAFVSLEGSGLRQRYLVGVRNRGHGSRARKPNNHRVNFRNDDLWKGVTALNINSQFTYLQHFGAAISLRSGLFGAESRPIQVRVNNVNLGNNGPQTYQGMYVANEALDGAFAAHRFPNDSAGNIYRALRDIAPTVFAYRGEDPDAYRNTWFKETNVSEDQWTDLIRMLQVIGSEDPYTVAEAEEVIDVDQWLVYLAVMAILNNRETSPNTGHNDDYFMYAGMKDPRFRLIYYDLDTIVGEGSQTSNSQSTIFGSTSMPTFQRFLENPEVLTRYYQTLRRLLDTTFSKPQFDALLSETIGSYVPEAVMIRMQSWMDIRRAYILSLLPLDLPPRHGPRALVQGVPRSPTPRRDYAFHIGGAGVSEYRYRLNGGPFAATTATSQPLSLVDLPMGTNRLEIVGGDAEGLWQSESAPTVLEWVIDPSWPSIRLNEVLARNVQAVSMGGAYPDLIELHNEGLVTINLEGMGLTDDRDRPYRYVFPAGVAVEPGGFLTLVAGSGTGHPLETGFGLKQEGEGVFLFDVPTGGRGLLDRVEFGGQPPDLSLGRIVGGEWHLGEPSFGQPNAAIPTGDPNALRINEWLALGSVLFKNDYLEIHNPQNRPVMLGGLRLTDNLAHPEADHVIADLTAISAGGFALFQADGKVEQGADHLGFKLSSDTGEIGLLSAPGEIIDTVMYGAQSPDRSEGRYPDAGPHVEWMALPTPGAPNVRLSLVVSEERTRLVTLTNEWRFNETEDLSQEDWLAPDYEASAWSNGTAVFAHNNDPLNLPLGTALDLGRMTYYFRTQFSVDELPAAGNLELTAAIDDAAVFYLNGQEIYRLGFDTTTTVAYDTPADRSVGDASVEGPFLVPTESLRLGVNVVAAELHQADISSADVVFGAQLELITLRTNQSLAGVQLSELMAFPGVVTGPGGRIVDWVEIVNTGAEPVELANYSLTDDITHPRQWSFAPGTSLDPGGFLVIAADQNQPPDSLNTGFSFNEKGEGVFLFAPPEVGGDLIDALEFGVQVRDFTMGRTQTKSGDWRLCLPTPGSANLEAILGDPRSLRINEWEAAPVKGSDWIELFNPNSQPVALGDLSLSDDPTNPRKSVLRPGSFIGSEADAYLELVADADPIADATHLSFRLAGAGDFIGLYDAAAQPIDGLSFGPQAPGISQGRFPDGTENRVLFTETASPGEGNFLWFTNLVINEVLTHTDPPFEDAIEILNLDTNTLDIAGWYLSNSSREPKRYRLPEGTTLLGGGFAVVYEYQFGDPEFNGRFALNSAHGDEVWLSQVDEQGALTGYRTAVEFGAAANGIPFGRYLTSVGADFVPLAYPTMGVESPTDLSSFRSGQGGANAAPWTSPVVINELMISPLPVAGTNDNTLDEYLELYNRTALPVALFDPLATTNTMRLRGGVDYDCPTGITMEAGEHLLVVGFDPETDPIQLSLFRARYDVPDSVLVLGPWSGRLANNGEALKLMRPDPPQQPPSADAGFVPYTQADWIDYRVTTPWPTDLLATGRSLQRLNAGVYGNEPNNWIAESPTAGRPNHLNPLDSDGDGLPDAWEMQFFGTLTRDGSGDYDGDGLSDLAELQVGTEPNNRESVLTLFHVEGENYAGFIAQPGVTYSIQARPALGKGAWQDVQNIGPLGETTLVMMPPLEQDVDERYYRVISPAQ